MSVRTIKLLVYATVLVLGMSWRITVASPATPQARLNIQSLSGGNLTKVDSGNAPDDTDDDEYLYLTQILESLDDESMDGTLLEAFVRLNMKRVFLPALMR